MRNVVAELQNQARTTSRYNSGTLFRAGRGGALCRRSARSRSGRGRFLAQQDEDSDGARGGARRQRAQSSSSANTPVAPGDSFFINGLPFRIVGLMPPKDQNSSYNGLDSDKIFVPYATMVRDLPPDDQNFHPGIVSDLIYVPAESEELEAGARPGEPRAGAQSPVRPRRPERRALSGTPSKMPNWWTACSPL